MNKIYIPGLETTTRIASGLCFTKFGIMSEKNNNTVEKVLLDPIVILTMKQFLVTVSMDRLSFKNRSKTSKKLLHARTPACNAHTRMNALTHSCTHTHRIHAHVPTLKVLPHQWVTLDTAIF